MPASRRTSAKGHDRELVGMALSGEKPSRATPSVEAVVQPIFIRIRLNEGCSGELYNVGMYDLNV